MEQANFTVKRMTTRLILSQVKNAISQLKSFEEVLNTSHHWTEEFHRSIRVYNETIKYVTGKKKFCSKLINFFFILKFNLK